MRLAGSLRSSGRRWQLSFAALFESAIWFRDGLREDLTRRLPRQQPNEREERCIRLRIPIDQCVVLVRNDIARSRRRPET